MYCRNCGNKLEENDIYCTECGNKVREEKKVPLINYHLLTSKQKNILKGLCFLLIVIISYTFINDHFFSEEATIKKYIQAYANNDYKNVIELSGIKKNELITNQIIKEKYGQATSHHIDTEILTTSKIKKEHIRTVRYRINDTTNTMNVSIKESGRKYLLFKNYIITSNDLTASNIKITVPKDATLIIDQKEIKQKSKEEENTTTYKIPSLLKKNVKITIKLSNGVTLTDIKSVFNNEEIDYSKLNYNEMDQKTNENLKTKIESSITNMVNLALQNKEYTAFISDNTYTDKLKNSTILSEGYNSFKEKYATKDIKNFKIKEVEIDNIKILENDCISVKSIIKYSYVGKDKKNHERTRTINQVYTKDFLIDEFYLNSLTYMF